MRRLIIALLLCLPCLGCGQTYMLYVPQSPFSGQGAEQAGTETEEADPRVRCEFMTVLIDYSSEGMGLSPADRTLGSRIKQAMAEEFESYGTHVTDRRKEAYWSLMILAANNERHDGYVFSALLSARNMNEGYGGGLASYANAAEESAEEDPVEAEIRETIQIPSMYNGLSYGPYTILEDQAREYVRRAYDAIIPTARQLCDFETADKAREAELDAQLPQQPQPL